MNAIVYAAEKGAKQRLKSLGNFIHGWDFVRFACLFQQLQKDQRLPNIAKLKEAIRECQLARNRCAHPAYDPNDRGLRDAKLAAIMEVTWDCLPNLNNLDQSEQNDIFEKLALLESVLFLRDPEVHTP
jgi:hypothetical protein